MILPNGLRAKAPSVVVVLVVVELPAAALIVVALIDVLVTVVVDVLVGVPVWEWVRPSPGCSRRKVTPRAFLFHVRR